MLHPDVVAVGWQRVMWTGLRKHPNGRAGMLEAFEDLVDPDIVRLEIRSSQLEFRKTDILNPIRKDVKVVAVHDVR